MASQITIEIRVSRWSLLRVLPSAWLCTCRAFGVHPWHPLAVAMLIRRAVATALWGLP